MRLAVLASARCDLLNGFWFYERQQTGLGAYFFDTVSADIESLLIYHGIHVQRYGYYCMFTHRFPYAVYYRIDGDSIVIRAILDCRADPNAAVSRFAHPEQPE